jgi:LysM repeat protein
VKGNPVVYKDPTGHWLADERPTQRGYYKDESGDMHLTGSIEGTVEKKDNLSKIAKIQLEKEIGKKNVTSKLINKRVFDIKLVNGLKSDTIKPGKRLIVGLSDKNIGKEGIESSLTGNLAIGVAGVALVKMTAATVTTGGPMVTKSGPTALKVMSSTAKELTRKTITTIVTNPIKTLVTMDFLKGAIDPNPPSNLIEQAGALARKSIDEGIEMIKRVSQSNDRKNEK